MYDVIILGGGPGGYRAAEFAGKAGLKAIIIEKKYLGGMCLNRGCIPTKTYYSHIIGKSNRIEDMCDRKKEVVEELREGITELMELSNVEVVYGYGRIMDVSDIKKVEVEIEEGKRIIEGKNLIIAVGSKTMELNFENNDLEEIIRGDIAVNNEELWNDDKVKSVAIAGAGVIAIEFATMLRKMGKEVILLKHSEEVLRRCDKDIKKRLITNLKRKRIKMLDYFEIEKVEKEEKGIAIYGNCKKGNEKILTDRLIIATSMVPIIEGYGLENTEIEYTNRGIVVDNHLRTNIQGVYAIGDVHGGMMLAHVAEYEALAVIKNILKEDFTIDYESVPYCIFSDPEIAAVGLTEKEAKKRGIDPKIGYASFGSNGMALAMNKTEGFVKVIADENNQLIGTHIMGVEASALIGEAALAIHERMTAEKVAYCVHAHPTLSECFKDALMNI